jgi:hypothetical protein
MESMIERRCFQCVHGPLAIRVWTRVDVLTSPSEEDEQRAIVMDTAHHVGDRATSLPAKVVVARALARIPFVTAVEVRAERDSAAIVLHSGDSL